MHVFCAYDTFVYGRVCECAKAKRGVRTVSLCVAISVFLQFLRKKKAMSVIVEGRIDDRGFQMEYFLRF